MIIIHLVVFCFLFWCLMYGTELFPIWLSQKLSRPPKPPRKPWPNLWQCIARLREIDRANRNAFRSRIK